MTVLIARLLLTSLLFIAGAAAAEAQAPASDLDRRPDVIYVPTRQAVVDGMLKLANVKASDIVYDLGCGDGRFVISAAKLGARGVGIDIDPVRIREATDNVIKAGLTDRVKIVHGDLFQTDIREATVVTLFLLPDLNLKLRPKLWKELKPGTRVVSNLFDMGDWKPDQEISVDGSRVYLWIVPPDAAKKLPK